MRNNIDTYNWPDNRKGAVNFGKEIVLTGRDDVVINLNQDAPDSVDMWFVTTGKRPILKISLDNGLKINVDGNLEIDNYIINETGDINYDIKITWNDWGSIYVIKGTTCFDNPQTN